MRRAMQRPPEFAPEVLQLALKRANFPLNSFDAVDRGILHLGHKR
jgi:hypothetical protein